jgi:hypothetical protein
VLLFVDEAEQSFTRRCKLSLVQTCSASGNVGAVCRIYIQVMSPLLKIGKTAPIDREASCKGAEMASSATYGIRYSIYKLNTDYLGLPKGRCAHLP